MPIPELIIKTAFQEALKACTKFLKEKKLKLASNEKDIEIAVSNHTNLINIWSR